MAVLKNKHCDKHREKMMTGSKTNTYRRYHHFPYFVAVTMLPTLMTTMVPLSLAQATFSPTKSPAIQESVLCPQFANLNVPNVPVMGLCEGSVQPQGEFDPNGGWVFNGSMVNGKKLYKKVIGYRQPNHPPLYMYWGSKANCEDQYWHVGTEQLLRAMLNPNILCVSFQYLRIFNVEDPFDPDQQKNGWFWSLQGKFIHDQNMVCHHKCGPLNQPLTWSPTVSPTLSPSTTHPTASPTHVPSHTPTTYPSISPTTSPTPLPSLTPTNTPTSSYPTESPSTSPTSSFPTMQPTFSPSTIPTAMPTSSIPTSPPTLQPTTSEPSISPTKAPSVSPTSTLNTPVPNTDNSNSNTIQSLLVVVLPISSIFVLLVAMLVVVRCRQLRRLQQQDAEDTEWSDENRIELNVAYELPLTTQPNSYRNVSNDGNDDSNQVSQETSIHLQSDNAHSQPTKPSANDTSPHTEHLGVSGFADSFEMDDADV